MTRVLSAKESFVVPQQQIRLGSEARRGRNSNLAPMQRVVRAAILEVAAQPLTHFEAQIWRHGHVSEVEQSVELNAVAVRC